MALEDSFPSRLVCKGCTELRPPFFAEDSYKHHAPRPLRLSLFLALFPCVVCRGAAGVSAARVLKIFVFLAHAAESALNTFVSPCRDPLRLALNMVELTRTTVYCICSLTEGRRPSM